jgi:C4-type Zn-finger protein
MNLPPFNPEATCPKCGHDQINCRWRVAEGPLAHKAPAPEWLSRYCTRCGYIWDESVLEAAPPAATEAPRGDGR